VITGRAIRWRTISGHFWQAFGAYVLVFLIWIAFNIAPGRVKRPISVRR
jgi:hypothetical protein